MTPAGWERLKTLFHGALDQPPGARRAWLTQAAGGDQDLLRDAEALLQAHDTAGDFLAQPVEVDPADFELVAPLEPTEPAFPPGTRLGSYVILEEIGRGGMGIVYLADDERLRRRVAIKSLQAAGGDAVLRNRLRREARAAATISHPGVATVYALEEIGDHLLLVTEYIAGRTLREEIRRGPVAPPRALTIAAEIADALAAAHDAGVVHRDLKPENVLISRGGAIKVVDFGIAHVEAPGTRDTSSGAVMGTPAYMAPEQLAGGRIDARADLYAAGRVLAEMIGPELPARIAAVVTRCLQADPDARYGSARELRHAIDAIRSDLDAPMIPGAGRNPAQWWWEFHQAAAAVTYWLLMIPSWDARGVIGGWPGRAFFVIALGAVSVASTLRLHLWFTARFYPAELRWVRARVSSAVRAADWLFALALVAGGLIIGDGPLAILLLSFGIGTGVAFLVIERATSRAAFRSSSPKAS